MMYNPSLCLVVHLQHLQIEEENLGTKLERIKNMPVQENEDQAVLLIQALQHPQLLTSPHPEAPYYFLIKDSH